MRQVFGWSRKWWPGLIPLAILWGFAVAQSTVPVESDLGERARQAVRDIVLDKTRIAVAGRDASFSAEAFSEEGRRSAVAAVDAVPGMRLVNDETRLAPQVSPYVWSIERDVVRVTVSGSAPLPAVKAKIAEAARKAITGGEVADQMGLARGAPARFEAAALLLVDQIARLKEGKLTLTDTAVSVSGMARELGGREALAAALRNLPEGYSVATNALRAPPYIFHANKDPVAVTLTLSGNVPDNASHAAIVAAAERKFVREKVVDQLKASVGAPAGFTEAVTAALGALSRLSTGTLTVSDREVTVSGDALFDVAADQIRGGLAAALPRGWQAKPEISVRPAAAQVDPGVCQELFNDLLGKTRIRFEPRQATISPDSVGLLDRIAETARRCPTAQIEIAGHTDGDGRPEANQALSERRAQAVADYLRQAGIASDRLQPVGFGATRPIAPEDTEDGKAHNRRIEITVRAP